MADGQFTSPGEVIQVGLQLLKEQEAVRELRLQQLRQEVQRGADQIERGEYREFSSGKEVAEWVEAEERKRLAA